MSLLSEDLKRLFACSTEGIEGVPQINEEFCINWETVVNYLCEDYQGKQLIIAEIDWINGNPSLSFRFHF